MIRISFGVVCIIAHIQILIALVISVRTQLPIRLIAAIKMILDLDPIYKLPEDALLTPKGQCFHNLETQTNLSLVPDLKTVNIGNIIDHV